MVNGKSKIENPAAARLPENRDCRTPIFEILVYYSAL
jgi:hypothetical protein